VSSSIQHLVISITEQWLQDTGVARDRFVTADLAPRLEAAGIAAQPTDSAEAYSTWRKRFGKQVERAIKGEAPFPLEWLPHWVAALPEPYQTRCRHHLCAALGSWFMPLCPPAEGGAAGPTRARLDELSKEFADVIQSGRPAWNGVYDEHDCREEVQRLQDELHELVAAGLAEMARIQAGTGIKSTMQTILEQAPFRGISD
jgi:hypothetical protein